MRTPVACALLALLVAAEPIAAARAAQASWGKKGVSLEHYRRDAIECGRRGYYLDVADTEPAKVLKRASDQLEANEAGLQNRLPDDVLGTVVTSAQIVARTRPQERMREIRTLLEDTTSACLRERGYVRFELNEAQRRRLGKLKPGSPQRHAYLHSLASDRRVLETQALAPTQP